MNIWWNILIELGGLAVLGFLYYIFQKRRIIRRSHLSILEDLEHFRFDLNNYIEKQKNLNNHTAELQQFSNQYEDIFQEQAIDHFSQLMPLKNCLPQHLQEKLEHIDLQINDLLASR